MQKKLRLLYRGSEHGFTPATFWQHCDGIANTVTVIKVSRALLSDLSLHHLIRSSAPVSHSLFILLLLLACVQVKESGNVFAAWTPFTWDKSASYIADPSCRTCIVSLVNAHNRPFRLRLRSDKKEYAVYAEEDDGPGFGAGCDVGLFLHEGSYCYPASFELDQEAEQKAGLQPLPFAYDKTLLSGVDDGKDRDCSYFSLAEVECYTLVD